MTLNPPCDGPVCDGLSGRQVDLLDVDDEFNDAGVSVLTAADEAELDERIAQAKRQLRARRESRPRPAAAYRGGSGIRQYWSSDVLGVA